MHGLRALGRGLLLCSSLYALSWASGAGAQTTPAPGGSTESAPAQPASVAAPTGVSEVVVTGQAYALQRSIETKRAKPIVSDTVSANEIGSLPEFGLGEALQRVPGVSFQINNGRGEAQFESVRGLNSDYNSVLVDGIALPSTEETRRAISFDVLPSAIANQVSVYKTYTADEPGDAIGGITNIRTHSAFDHPGFFFAGEADGSYWDAERLLHPNQPSGEGDFRISKTFGADNQFGALLQLSYYERSSNSLNSFSGPYSYYGYNAAAGGTQAVVATPLTPTTSVAGLTPLADRRVFYNYDNIRQREGAFGKLEWDDHHTFHAHLTSGLFVHYNDEYRDQQYLNRGGVYTPPGQATANTTPTALFTSPSTAYFSNGQALVQFDKYNQYRQISYIEAGGGATLDAKTRVDAVFNYGMGYYRQDTTEDAFNSAAVAATSPTATGAPFAFNDVGEVGKAQLFVPVSETNFHNPALYNQTYTLMATDKSKTLVPQERIDFVHNMGAEDTGLGYQFGYQHRQTDQTYFYHEFRYNPAVANSITLANIGASSRTFTPYDAGGMNILVIDTAAVTAYLKNNPGSYVVAASNLSRSSANNFSLTEVIDAGYIQGSWRKGPLYALLGVRYETTDQTVRNFQPATTGTGFTTASYVEVDTPQTYSKLLPALNVNYDLRDDFKVRAGISRTLGRARFSDLGQNSSLTFSGTTATESIANPHLQPRVSNNYDLSFEYYPHSGAQVSAALFLKDISNEIFSFTTTQQNVSLPGFTGNNFTLTTTSPQNLAQSEVRGLEFGFTQARLDLLLPRLLLYTGWMRYFGLTANTSFNTFDAPRVQMADKLTYRKLPQLVESAKSTTNVAIIFAWWKLGGEVAYNHTSKQPISFDLTNAVNDQWYRATDTFDAQLSYKLTPKIAFRLQAKNFTDEKNQKVVGPNQSLNYSLLSNGRAYYAGVSFAY